MASLVVRRAVATEAQSIHELLVRAFESFKPQYTDACFDATVLDMMRVAERIREGPVWVCFQGDRLVGTVAATTDDRGVYVRGMGVDPDARRAGIGLKLLNVVEAYARRKDIDCMWLSTTTFLDASQALYRSFGFELAPGPSHLEGTPLVSFTKRVRVTAGIRRANEANQDAA